MTTALKLSDALIEDATLTAAVEHRSVPNQIEYWARIGKATLENPDMSPRFILDTLLSIEEVKHGKVRPYQAG